MIIRYFIIKLLHIIPEKSATWIKSVPIRSSEESTILHVTAVLYQCCIHLEAFDVVNQQKAKASVHWTGSSLNPAHVSVTSASALCISHFPIWTGLNLSFTLAPFYSAMNAWIIYTVPPAFYCSFVMTVPEISHQRGRAGRWECACSALERAAASSATVMGLQHFFSRKTALAAPNKNSSAVMSRICCVFVYTYWAGVSQTQEQHNALGAIRVPPV